MALTENQINDQFQSQIGRAATPYEVKTYATASPQTIATLKDTYSKLNPDASLSDYLAHSGQDNSLSARQALGAKYGITNIGTAEGNTALLTALKSGKPPAPAPIAGSIVAPGPVTPSVTPPATVPGSVSDAATKPATSVPTTDPSSPDYIKPDATSSSSYTPNPLLSTTLTQYQSVQSQIADIDSALSSALAQKKAEVERSGGLVNEAQLMGEVQAEEAPLISQRKDLVTQQSNLGKTYQQLLAADKQAQQESQFNEKQNQQASEFNVTQSDKETTLAQNQQKIEQAGWKSAKVNITDAAGNVLGQKVIWTQDPASKGTTIASDNAAQYTTTSSGSGGINKMGVTNVGNVTTTPPPNASLADGYTPAQVLQSLISGPVVPVKGSTVPLSQQDLYNLAVADMLGSTSGAGGRTPSGAIIAVKDKETQIQNAYGLTPFDIAAAKEQFKGMSAANTALLSTAAFTKTYAETAKDNLQLALNESAQVPRSGAKLVNNYSQWASGNFTPNGPLAQFETYIYTAAREYAKVTSGGAKSSSGLTDSAQSEANKLLNAAQSPEVFKSVVQAMQADMDNVTSNFDKQTNSFPAQVKALYGLSAGDSVNSGGATGISKGSMSSKDYVNKVLTQAGVKYDDFVKQVPAGKIPVIKNSDGTIGYVDSQNEVTSDYTPI